jgi:hypothetical protein
MDATASMMEEYFVANENLDLPRNWGEFLFDGKKIYLQFSSVNSTLESLADKLLGDDAAAALIHEDESTSEDYYDQLT